MSSLPESTNRTPLLPERHPEGDFFVCDIFDAVPKGDVAGMAHPFFTLSTKPDRKIREYKSADGKHYIKINPSVDGMATIHDRDVLIFAISQIMAALNEGRTVSSRVRFKGYDFLVATNRQTNGQGYDALKMAFRRLQGTQIETNVTSGGQEELRLFSLVKEANIIRETREGRMVEAEVELSDWVFNAIRGKEVLTLSRGYFRLRKPLERKLYELCRKYCGQNPEWKFRIKWLHEKTGSLSTLAEFKRMLTAIIDANALHDHIPDYNYGIKKDTVYVWPKHAFKEKFANQEDKDVEFAIDSIKLHPRTYTTAKKFASGYDVYGELEGEWRSMLRDKKSIPSNPGGSFVQFVKWYVKEKGPARGAGQSELF